MTNRSLPFRASLFGIFSCGWRIYVSLYSPIFWESFNQLLSLYFCVYFLVLYACFALLCDALTGLPERLAAGVDGRLFDRRPVLPEFGDLWVRQQPQRFFRGEEVFDRHIGNQDIPQWTLAFCSGGDNFARQYIAIHNNTPILKFHWGWFQTLCSDQMTGLPTRFQSTIHNLRVRARSTKKK